MRAPEKLAAIGGPSVSSPPDDSLLLESYGTVGEELSKLLRRKNGFFAFESALHLFPFGGREGLEEWNTSSCWRYTYDDLVPNAFFFAEDIFGNQFSIFDDHVYLFDAETGDMTLFAKDLDAWAEAVLRDFNVQLGFPAAHEWQTRNGKLLATDRLVPKIPFVCGGAYATENLYAVARVKAMRSRGNFAKQIRDLPNGSKIEFKIVD